MIHNAKMGIKLFLIVNKLIKNKCK